MGFIRFLIWTSMCIALGVFIGTWEIDGKTPAQHFAVIWKRAPAMSVSNPLKKAPTETHSVEDRAAVDRLLAKRTTK